MIPQTKDITHMLYPRVEDPKDADALAWVFKNKDEFVPYYFKFPELGANEVRIKIHYTGLCHSDIMTGREHWGPANFPVCPGHEVAGEIILVGADVKDLKKGDIVGVGPFRNACFKCEQCKHHHTNLCTGMDGSEKFLYGLYFGGYATHIQVPHEHAIVLPQGMDLANMPPVMCAGCTVFAPMKRHLHQKGAKFGILGIGGLGHLAVQYSKAMGFHTVAFTSTADKVDYIKKLGADEVIVVDKEFKELKKHAHTLNGIINTLPVGGLALQEAYASCLKPGGTYILVGLPDVKENFSLSFFTIIINQLNVVGSIVSSIKETKETLDFTHQHKVKVEVETFKFEDFPKALHRLEKERPFFRCVVNVLDFNKVHFPNK